METKSPVKINPNKSCQDILDTESSLAMANEVAQGEEKEDVEEEGRG